LEDDDDDDAAALALALAVAVEASLRNKRWSARKDHDSPSAVLLPSATV
jgi:hypothetical protein